MGVTIKQYEGSNVSPKDDAILHEIFNGQKGIINGCEITYLGSNQIRVGEGYAYICGREIQIEEETLLSTFAENETEGEIILQIDLLADTPAKLMARVPREELVQSDINGSDSVYEYLLATYKAGEMSLSDLNIVYEKVKDCSGAVSELNSKMNSIESAMNGVTFYTLTEEDLDQTDNFPSAYCIGMGEIEGSGAVSFHLRWMDLQFRITANVTYVRQRYGNNGWTGWKAVANYQ